MKASITLKAITTAEKTTQTGIRTMTTVKNTFHGTEYKTRKTRQEIDALLNKPTYYRTASEKAFSRRCKSALCGIAGCECGNDIGERI